MKRAFPALLALLCATLALLIATSSSPLYAANFWTDTNIYFTIGRGMTRGLMPYRDLFDHKGPLLFILYALGAAISDTSFIGVFILETLSLAAAVYAGWRTVSLFGEGRLTLLSMPILAAVVCCCTAFTQGGSAEEFALPALAAGVYLALALMVRPGEGDGRRALGFGAAAGSNIGLLRYTYTHNVREYISGVLGDKGIIAEEEELTPFDRASEYLMLGMRTAAGISREEYRSVYQSSFDKLEEMLEVFQENGWAVCDNGRWHFTPGGFLVSNVLIGVLLESQTKEKFNANPWIREAFEAKGQKVPLPTASEPYMN